MEILNTSLVTPNGSLCELKTYIGNDIITVVKSLLDNNEWHYLNDNWKLIKNSVNYSAENGKLDLMKWARENGCPG